MAAVLRDTTLYDKLHVKKYVGDARDRGGRVVPIPFELTVVSPSTVADTYNMCVLPANCKVVGLECTSDGLGPSAGGGRTFALGDSGDADRYMVASDFDVANAQGTLANTGQGYKPSADTIVVGTIAGAAGVVGKVVKGCFYVIPAA
jgi:hypothetical protein